MLPISWGQNVFRLITPVRPNGVGTFLNTAPLPRTTAIDRCAELEMLLFVRAIQLSSPRIKVYGSAVRLNLARIVVTKQCCRNEALQLPAARIDDHLLLGQLY